MRVEVLLYEGCDELDALGPYEVLSHAAASRTSSEVLLVTLDGDAPITGAHGARMYPHAPLSDRPGLLVVPGGGWIGDAPAGARAEVAGGELPRAIAARHASGTTIASVCTGAMLLAAGGLLDGRPAVTHHGAIEDLRAAGARVIEDARVVDDGDVITAGGVTSGLDLALWMVEREFGAVVAEATSRELEYARRDAVWQSASA